MAKYNETDAEFVTKCYEAYKLFWMLSHGYTLKDLIDECISHTAQNIEEDITAIPTNEAELRRLSENTPESFHDYGFSGSLFACREEFEDSEFLDEEFMNTLLSLMPDADENKARWHKLVDSKESTQPEQTYYVTIAADTRYTVCVTAPDLESAKDLAKEAFWEHSFETEIVDTDIVIVEDENGNYLYEK